MPPFASVRSFQRFAYAVSRERRYTRDVEQQQYLDAVVSSSISRRQQIAEGTVLWRAQLGHATRSEQVSEDESEDFPCAFPRERMKPLVDRAAEGRANPKGIPFLYTSVDGDTAVAEVRPWVGAYVSVAELRVLRPLSVVNCVTGDRGLWAYSDDEPDEAERERANWRDIDRAFSRPVTPHEQVANYVPTQVLAELFRNESLDGIVYRSALGSGHNVAIFDLTAADVVSCGLFLVRSVSFDVRQIDP